MQIDNKYRVASDKYNIILQKRAVKKNGNEEYDTIAYFYSFHELLKYFADMEIKSTGLKDLELITVKQDEIYKTISGINNVPVDQFHDSTPKKPHSEA